MRIVHLKKDLKEREELAEETLFQVERRAGRKALRWECPWCVEKQSTQGKEQPQKSQIIEGLLCLVVKDFEKRMIWLTFWRVHSVFCVSNTLKGVREEAGRKQGGYYGN